MYIFSNVQGCYYSVFMTVPLKKSLVLTLPPSPCLNPRAAAGVLGRPPRSTAASGSPATSAGSCSKQTIKIWKP